VLVKVEYRGRVNNTTLTTVKTVDSGSAMMQYHRGYLRGRNTDVAERGAGHSLSHGRGTNPKPLDAGWQSRSTPMVMDCDNGGPPTSSTHV